MFFQYIVLGLVFAAGIGPANIETAKRGLIDNSLSALFFYLGNVVVDAFYILIIIFGFSFFVENPILKIVLGIFGVLYLLYLGIGNIVDYFKKDVINLSNKPVEKKRWGISFLEGMLINLANPMAVASWVAFYSVVSGDFVDGLVFNFMAVMFGAILVGVIIVCITYFFKRIMSEKIMKIVSLISGLVLMSFSFLFANNLFNLFQGS